MENKVSSHEARYTTALLAVVTLYNPDPAIAARNIGRYVDVVDCLIVWDNSPLEAGIRERMEPLLHGSLHKIVWHGDGNNRYIASAVNYAWRYATVHHYDLILLMDDDSSWTDFRLYRKDVETLYRREGAMVFTPYVEGCDSFPVVQEIQQRTLFINSGTVIPTQFLNMINGIDEEAFPLDALDHDMALSIIAHGKQIVCLTHHRLKHSLGNPARMGLFRLFTPNYNRQRTYSITRSHLICYRKHRQYMSKEQKQYVLKEIILWKIIRILFAEPDKIGRLRAFVKGLIDGLNYNIKNNSSDQ